LPLGRNGLLSRQLSVLFGCLCECRPMPPWASLLNPRPAFQRICVAKAHGCAYGRPLCVDSTARSAAKPCSVSLTNGVTSPVTSVASGGTVTYTCNSGYTRSGSASLTCSLGSLSGAQPTCTRACSTIDSSGNTLQFLRRLTELQHTMSAPRSGPIAVMWIHIRRFV